MKALSKKEMKDYLKNYFFIAIGLAIFTFGWTAFLIPSNLMGGGVSGIASLIYFSTDIPVGISTFAINFVLLAFAYRILGSKFSINTIICTAILSGFFAILQPLFPKPLVEDLFLCALIGSMIAGVGGAIALNHGGNTGGIDIVVLVISHFRNISYGTLTMYINIGIIASSYFVIHSVEVLVYCYITMLAYIATADMVIDGHKQTYQIMVFSAKNKEIADRINQELGRGATLLKGYGSYTKEDSEILLVIAHRSDRIRITRVIKEIDDSAFLTITKTSGVFGKNFDKLKL